MSSSFSSGWSFVTVLACRAFARFSSFGTRLLAAKQPL